MRRFIERLLDSEDRTADCLSLGIFLGFVSFTALLWLFCWLEAAATIFPSRVHFDAGSYASALVVMGGAYASVLGATTAAYRWRSTTPAPESRLEQHEDQNQ